MTLGGKMDCRGRLRVVAAVLALLLVCVFSATAQGKAIITVLDFSRDAVSLSEMRSIITLLSSALFQTEKFTVIDVNERERLLQELEFSAGECTDESCLLEIGRMLSAEAIVVGNIGKVGDRYILSAKMLETETARTLNTADGVYPSLNKLVDDVVPLARKLSARTVHRAGTEVAAAEAGKKPAKAKAEPRAKPAKEAKARKPAKAAAGPGKGLSLGVAAGATIPVGSMSQALGVGVPALVSLGYNLELNWGLLGLGGVTGIQYQATRTDARFLYTMLTVPLAAEVSWRSKFLLPYYLRAEVLGGIALNGVLYKETYPYRSNQLDLSPLVAPVLGFGYQFSPKLGLELDVTGLMILFDGSFYFGVSPTVRVEIKL
jgi:hypothetical protein